jgi:ABC-type phosphate/phosphonate transport system substrate-binding protein
MYNLPEMQGANSAFWAALRTELARLGIGDVPSSLDFTRKPVPALIESDTLFTQVCGYPLQTIYRGQAALLGAPVYTTAHCAGTTHAGVFLVHRDSKFQTLTDLKGCTFVYNSIHSNSGMNLPRRALAELSDGKPYFSSIEETHSQPGNIERVALGKADATCVDCVTYAFFCRHRPTIGALTRVLAVTPPSPSIPFVTSHQTPDAVQTALRAALANVARAPAWAEVRAGLMLADIVPIEPSGYTIQLDYEQQAATLGYPQLV